MVAASGVALANNIAGNGADNRLVGTNGKDTISGGGGGDDVFGRGGADRLFGDSGNDDVHGGKGADRLQAGLGQDDLFGDAGDDFANAIDGQTNDRIDCGPGAGDVAGVDLMAGVVDRFSASCEFVYYGSTRPPPPPPPPFAPTARGGSGTDLSAIDTRAEAEQAEEDGLLRQIR
jgi:hypothetical protein